MPTILFLDTNLAGNGTRAMRHAQQWGYRTHFLTRDLGDCNLLPHNPIDFADEVTVVDTLDIVKLMRLHYANDVVATIAFDELRVVQAALLGEFLGTKHNPPVRGIVNARFKDRTRALLDGTPYTLRHKVLPLATAPSDSPIGYPCVVKPVDEANSTGVRVCYDAVTFRAAIETLCAMADSPNRRGYHPSPAFLVEEYVKGDEYSAELVWSTRQSDWRLIGFTRKQISAPPWCLETAEVFPHRFPIDLGEQVLAQLRQCLSLLGLRGTVVHLEFRVRDGQVCVIDVNPRSAGGGIPDLVQHALGVDLVALHLAAHLGMADKLMDRAAPRGYVGVRYLVPPRAGTVEGFDLAPMEDPALIDLRTVATPLEVTEAATSNSAQTVQIVAMADSPEDVDRALIRHAARVTHRYATEWSPPSLASMNIAAIGDTSAHATMACAAAPISEGTKGCQEHMDRGRE